LKIATTIGMMCLCNKTIESRWTRRINFALIWRVAQEAKSDKATFASMIVIVSAIGA
jgi:hypothetical protein